MGNNSHNVFFFFFLIYIQKASKTYKTPIVTPGKKKKTQTVKKSTTPRIVKKKTVIKKNEAAKPTTPRLGKQKPVIKKNEAAGKPTYKYVKVAVYTNNDSKNGEEEYVLLSSEDEDEAKVQASSVSSKTKKGKAKKTNDTKEEKNEEVEDNVGSDDDDEDDDEDNDDEDDDNDGGTDSNESEESEDDESVAAAKKGSNKTATPNKTIFASIFAKRGDKRADQRSWSLKFSFVIGGPNSVKDFCYVRLENSKEVCFFMRAPYFQTIFSAYAELYVDKNDKFKETLLNTMSLTRRVVPFGENNALLSDGGGSKYNVYGLFFIIPKKSSKAFVKYLKKVMRSKELKTTIKEWKKSLEWSNKTTEIICDFQSDLWKSITENTKEDFENYCDEVGSLDAFILDKDIEDVLRIMYAYKGDNFHKDSYITKTGWKHWKEMGSKSSKKLKKVKIEKE